MARFVDISKQPARIADSANSFLAIFLSVVLFRASTDIFAWVISPGFANYGISTVGEPFSAKFWISCFSFLLIAPLYTAFISRKTDVLDVGIAVLFLVSYVPLSAAWWITDGSSSFFWFATTFWIVTLSLLILMRWKRPAVGLLPSSLLNGIGYIYACIVVALGVILLARFGVPKGFGFDSAYERRADFSQWLSGSGIFAYAVTWSVYVFCSFLILLSRSLLLKLLGIAFVILIYSVSGAKIFILLIAAFPLTNFIAVRNLSWVLAPLLALLVAVSGIFFRLGEVWTPTLLQRLLIMPADIAFRYTELFQDKLLYSYSFLSRFVTYPYVELPGKLVGSIYYTDGDNATAGFLVDVYVNVGWYGLLPLVLFFVALRSMLYPAAAVVIVLPFVAQLLDTPLPTALLTGGGGLAILVAFILTGDQITQKKRSDCLAQSIPVKH